MAMKGFENECISLLRRIDTERKRMRQMTCPWGPTETAKKGKRELRNLISSVNYEGRKVTNACTSSGGGLVWMGCIVFYEA
jgi:hypothetical protein